jgi:hypothetical protein
MLGAAGAKNPEQKARLVMGKYYFMMRHRLSQAII